MSIDHKAESEKAFDAVGEGFSQHEGWTEHTAVVEALNGVRHAILHQADMQRQANLIALWANPEAATWVADEAAKKLFNLEEMRLK